MFWTKTPPTKAGWYWALWGASDDPQCVKVDFLSPGNENVWVAGGDYSERFPDFRLWSNEPILPPVSEIVEDKSRTPYFV